MEVVCRRTTSRSSESRTTEEAGQVAAPRGAGAGSPRRFERFAVLPAFANKSAAELGALRPRAARRAVGDRARARIRVVERAARRSRSAHALVRRRRRRVHPLRDGRRVGPRGAAARASSRHCVGIALHRARARRRGGGRGATAPTIPSSRRSRVDRRTGSRCSTCATPACTPTILDAWTAWSRSRGGCAALGANPNAEYHWNWHPELPRTALWARASARSATCRSREVLLDAGANPTDGVTVHIAGGGGNLAALELLHRFGVDVNGIPGGVPPLVYMMFWATESRRAALAARTRRGPEPRVGPRRRSAAPRRGAAMGRADGRAARRARRRSAATPRPTGARRTRWRSSTAIDDIAAWLLAHGAKDELSPLERFVAACARGDRAAATAMLAARPDAARRASSRAPPHAASPGRERATPRCSRRCSSCGFDPHAKDKDDVTALHRAAMGGPPGSRARAAEVRRGRQRAGRHVLGDAARLGRGRTRSTRSAGADHVAVARLLIAAGSPLEWTPPEGAPGPERTLEGLIELRRAAMVSASG